MGDEHRPLSLEEVFGDFDFDQQITLETVGELFLRGISFLQRKAIPQRQVVPAAGEHAAAGGQLGYALIDENDGLRAWDTRELQKKVNFLLRDAIHSFRDLKLNGYQTWAIQNIQPLSREGQKVVKKKVFSTEQNIK